MRMRRICCTSLGDLPERVAPLGIASLHFFARKTYTLACNWKVYVDNYLDGGYHVPHLHKGLNSVLDYKEYTIENSARYSLQSSPMVSSQEHESFAATRTGDRAYYYWLYPNFMINIYEGVMDTNLVLAARDGSVPGAIRFLLCGCEREGTGGECEERGGERSDSG